MHLIVGLGNPGEKYLKSRHNAGFIILREITGDDWTSESREKSLIHHDEFLGQELCFALPQTFMNNSGLAVKTLQKKFGISPEHIVVVHDDIDLPFGTLRIAYGSGAGGHNGVRSIIDQMGTNEFVRIKIGIAPVGDDGKARKPSGGFFTSAKTAVARFVLKDFTKSDIEKLKSLAPRVKDIIAALVRDGRGSAMNRFN